LSIFEKAMIVAPALAGVLLLLATCTERAEALALVF
jgi:hypothetical protein